MEQTVSWPTFTEDNDSVPPRPTRAATMADDQTNAGAIALTITGKDIWDKLVKIESEVSGTPAVVADHEIRIRSLERKVWIAVALGSTLGGGAGSALTTLLGG